MDSKFFLLIEIVEDLKKHNPVVLQEFSLQLYKMIARYRRIRNPSSLIQVKPPEDFYPEIKQEREDPICFQTGGMLQLYRDLKVDDSKKIKLDNQEEDEEGETKDDTAEDIDMKDINTGKI